MTLPRRRHRQCSRGLGISFILQLPTDSDARVSQPSHYNSPWKIEIVLEHTRCLELLKDRRLCTYNLMKH